MPTKYDTDILALGMREQPGLATAWPDLVRVLNDLYTARVSNLPYIPAGWLAGVKSLNGQRGSIIVPIPALRPNGQPVAPLPPWLDTPDKLASWAEIARLTQQAYVKYAAGKAEEGRAELERLQANAEFWNSSFITGLIKVQEAAKEAVSFGFNKILFPILLGAGIIGAVLVYTKYGKR